MRRQTQVLRIRSLLGLEPAGAEPIPAGLIAEVRLGTYTVAIVPPEGFGVPTDKAYFYPEGVEGLFEIYYAPADTFETVNTLGLPLYARMIPDRDRDEWVRLEIESNPLPICTRPQVLRSARRT